MNRNEWICMIFEYIYIYDIYIFKINQADMFEISTMQHVYLGQNRFFQAGLMTIGAPGDLSAFDRLRDLRAKMANHFQAGCFFFLRSRFGSMYGIVTYIYRKNQRNVAVFLHFFYKDTLILWELHHIGSTVPCAGNVFFFTMNLIGQKWVGWLLRGFILMCVMCQLIAYTQSQVFPCDLV